MKRLLALLLVFATLVVSVGGIAYASDDENTTGGDTIASAPEIKANGALLMEASTGEILYAKGELEAASPASVTKIMTLLLVAEALEKGFYSTEDTVTVSANAASMGGSQVFLEEGEQMSVEELIKCTVIASANDAAVALAEYTSGSEAAFVDKMNERAEELGLLNTCFENTTGLDDTTVNHYTCPRDIAVMSRELIKHEIILRYSSMWQDTIRDGEFTLTNTNRLVRYYDGCNGLKTGSTDKAGYCISATAKRGNMQLIAVVMGAPTRDIRNECARILLDMGFSGYTLMEYPEEFLEQAEVKGGMRSTMPLYSSGFTALIKKEDKGKLEVKYQIPESVTAPIYEGQGVGKILYLLDGEQVGECLIVAGADVQEAGFLGVLWLIWQKILCGK